MRGEDGINANDLNATTLDCNFIDANVIDNIDALKNDCFDDAFSDLI